MHMGGYSPVAENGLHGESLMIEAGQMFSDGKTYERMMGRWSKLVGRIFLGWLGAPKRFHWVEIGCGNGAFTEELIACTAPRAVDSIDPSEGQLAFAPARTAPELAQFHLGDAQVGGEVERYPTISRSCQGYSRSGRPS